MPAAKSPQIYNIHSRNEYLEKFSLIDDIQHGFRPVKSVIIATVSFIESIMESVDKGKFSIGIFVDLSKAFDRVEHNILLEKLHTLGEVKNYLKWFQSYLLNCCQYVEIAYLTPNNIITTFFRNTESSPGVHIRPLLFLCFLKDINSTLLLKPSSKLFLAC